MNEGHTPGTFPLSPAAHLSSIRLRIEWLRSAIRNAERGAGHRLGPALQEAKLADYLEGLEEDLNYAEEKVFPKEEDNGA